MIQPKPLDWAPFREAFPTILRGKANLNAEEHHHDLVWELFAALEAIALRQRESGEEPLAIRRVKSKYGGLQFDADNAPPEADDLMAEAEDRSDPPEDPVQADPSDG